MRWAEDSASIPLYRVARIVADKNRLYGDEQIVALGGLGLVARALDKVNRMFGC